MQRKSLVVNHRLRRRFVGGRDKQPACCAKKIQTLLALPQRCATDVSLLLKQFIALKVEQSNRVIGLSVVILFDSVRQADCKNAMQQGLDSEKQRFALAAMGKHEKIQRKKLKLYHFLHNTYIIRNAFSPARAKRGSTNLELCLVVVPTWWLMLLTRTRRSQQKQMHHPLNSAPPNKATNARGSGRKPIRTARPPTRGARIQQSLLYCCCFCVCFVYCCCYNHMDDSSAATRSETGPKVSQ